MFDSGQWDDTNKYLNYKTTGVLVDETICFENFSELDIKGSSIGCISFFNTIVNLIEL